MAQRLEQSQAAVQTQQLSSMQVAVAKLVELPVTELAEKLHTIPYEILTSVSPRVKRVYYREL